MAGRGRRGAPRDQSEHDREHEQDRDRDHDRDHHRHGGDGDGDGHRDHSGDDPKKHAAIIARRWEGSPPPTAERYAHALKQWHALPGAVVWPATDVEPPAPPSPDGEPKP
jgi:ABC-type Zn2+ transport system substrate-binding protein/surface adhesin